MVLLGVQYWNPSPNGPYLDKEKPVYPLLMTLAREKHFEDKVLLTDSLKEILGFIVRHSPL